MNLLKANDFNTAIIIPFAESCPACESTDEQGGEVATIDKDVANEESANEDKDNNAKT
jgi:hypothetical protein